MAAVHSRKGDTALEHGGGRALAFVAFLAVYREGAETALFYQALFNEGAHVVLPISLGIIAGFAALAVIFTLFYRFGVRIPLRPFFSVTSVLLYYMAFVFMGNGHPTSCRKATSVPITLDPRLPDGRGARASIRRGRPCSRRCVLLALFVFARGEDVLAEALGGAADGHAARGAAVVAPQLQPLQPRTRAQARSRRWSRTTPSSSRGCSRSERRSAVTRPAEARREST